MAETTKKYYIELNIFRALVIIWVVIGHSFDQGLDFLGYLHYYAYTFHMPAFFMLSGLLFSKKVGAINSFQQGCTAVLDRAKRLLIPYFFFTAFSYLLKYFLQDYANHDLPEHPIWSTLTGADNPNGGIWFLHALFVFSFLAILLCKVPPLLTFLFMLGLKVASLFVNLPTFGLHPLHRVYAYGVYFFFGIFFFRYYGALSERICRLFQKKRLLTFAGTVILLAVSFGVVRWNQLNPLSFAGTDFLLTLANIAIWYLVAVWCQSYTVSQRLLTPVGNYGMDIYMLGYYVQITLRVVLMSLLGLPYLVYSLAMCICGLLLPIPISKYFVRKFRLTRALLLGDFKKEVNTNGKKA